MKPSRVLAYIKKCFSNKWMILLSLKFDCQCLITRFLIFLFLFIFYHLNYNGLNTSLFCTWVFNAVKINDVLRCHTGHQQCLELPSFPTPALDIHTEVGHCGFSSWQYAQLKDSSLYKYKPQNYGVHGLLQSQTSTSILGRLKFLLRRASSDCQFLSD